MKKILIAAAAVAAFAACSTPPQKKVVVMSSGKMVVTGDAIKLEPGTQHNEETITVNGDKITVNSPSGAKEYPVTEPGSWLLNLKNDTLIGSYQSFGEAGSREGRISQEQMQERMDSLSQLMTGSNVSAAKRNYFLAPGDFKKITSAENAIIVGPFKGMPASLEPDKNGQVPEVYKFITNKDARETLSRIEKMLKEG
ncbi:hypothetical protein [Flavihumibacter solisilvae]|jgi:hypothetical protein|uniref:DUF4369 domain-containing protein n=1 Tax=Flavihumibacter solisilvae TaxID=1349421 RepID=A0A0C1LHG1_9BACT|nr:hypothetical protein [Flavihumibacter solisilvae]KIC94773.1 hypothetical protein OI18_09870 [Flavihumibacter solisilvae]